MAKVMPRVAEAAERFGLDPTALQRWIDTVGAGAAERVAAGMPMEQAVREAQEAVERFAHELWSAAAGYKGAADWAKEAVEEMSRQVYAELGGGQ